MLAESIIILLPILLRTFELSLPLLHQIFARPLCLLHADREVAHFVIHAISEFLGKLLEGFVLVDLLSPPVPLLRRDIGGRWNQDIWIHEEQCKQLAVSWLCRVRELEGRDPMLKHVRKDEETILAGQDLT